jgi:hypothetical protein
VTTPVVAKSISYEEYVQLHANLVAAALAFIQVLLAPYRVFALPFKAWLGLLALIYPIVEDYRRQSSELAREFYDSERRDKTGIETPHPTYLAEYEPDWFQEAMRPVRKAFSAEDASEGAETKVLSAIAKEIENGGRRTMLRAVEDDPEVRGWARVQGGEDSCAFCAMLISRGPVYQFADTAGLDADDTSAVEIFRQAESGNDNGLLDELMTRWHPNCDCKVVPVFDKANWPGMKQYREAEKLWEDSTKGYATGKTSGPGAVTDALNAFRRAIYQRQKKKGAPAEEREGLPLSQAA